MRSKGNFNQSDEVTDINISPLIDMVFILLIFFIVTTVFVEERGMAANTPDPGATPPLQTSEEERVKFLIKANRSVEFRGRDVGVGGVRAIVRPAMNNEKYPILIEVEPEAVTNLVVQVMDECYNGGAEQVTMKALPKSE